jgi:hypothetical protein
MENIEEFNIVVGEIFGVCYQSFPFPMNIHKVEIGQFVKDSLEREHDSSRINLGEREYELVEHTLSWLVQAGYIWTDSAESRASSMYIRLSPLGLETLNSIPDSLTDSLGASLSKGCKSLGKELFLTTVTTALSIGFSAAGA